MADPPPSEPFDGAAEFDPPATPGPVAPDAVAPDPVAPEAEPSETEPPEAEPSETEPPDAEPSETEPAPVPAQPSEEADAPAAALAVEDPAPAAPAQTVVSDQKEAPAKPGIEEALRWAGHRLDEIGAASVGKVEGVYVDAESGEPEWLQARMGRFGHHSLVPARDAVAGIDHVWVPYSRDEIRRAPRIDPGTSLTRAQEQQLLEHYGIGSPDAGRGHELAQRLPDALTLKPAG